MTAQTDVTGNRTREGGAEALPSQTFLKLFNSFLDTFFFSLSLDTDYLVP